MTDSKLLKKFSYLFIFSFFLLFFYSEGFNYSRAFAQDSVVVPNGECRTINRHGECRGVTANHPSNLGLNVPVRSAAEWTSFRNSPPTGVAVNNCTSTPGGFSTNFIGGRGCSGSQVGFSNQPSAAGCANSCTQNAATNCCYRVGTICIMFSGSAIPGGSAESAQNRSAGGPPTGCP